MDGDGDGARYELARMAELVDEAVDTETPANRLDELARQAPYEVAVMLVGNWAMPEASLRELARRFAELRRAVALHWNGPLDMMEEVAVNDHSNTVLQSYMDRIGADETLWARLHAAREAAPIPGGPPLGLITREFRQRMG